MIARPRLGAILGAMLLFVSLGGRARSEEVHWAPSFANAMEQAQAEQKYVMVDFFTVWCHWCKVLDAKTYTDERVIALTDKMVSVKVNAEVEREVAARYGVRAYPTIAILNPDGSLRQRMQGFVPPERFAPMLEEVTSTESERYGLEQQVRTSPADSKLRLEFSRVLTRSGKYAEAVAQLDTLLGLKEIGKDARTEPELERSILLVRQGSEAKDARKALEKWVKKRKGHPRRPEAIYFLGKARELEGKPKDARKWYEELTRVAPGTWYADAAQVRLQALSENG